MKRTREALMCCHSGVQDFRFRVPQTFPAGTLKGIKGQFYPAIVGPAPFMPMFLWVRGEPRLRTGTQNVDYGINQDFLGVDE